jgi:hypothetical protein
MSHNEEVNPLLEMTSRQILAEGWRLTGASLAQKGMELPNTVRFEIDGEKQTRATRLATLDELAKAIAALDGATEHRDDDTWSVRPGYLRREIEELNDERAALVELEKRASRSGVPASTTVTEALFPNLFLKKKTASQVAEIKHWRAIRKEEGLKIDPETAEVHSEYAQIRDPYDVLAESELPEEIVGVRRTHFARAPGSDIWVEFGDLPDETRDKLWGRYFARPKVDEF